jgi:hypothetical protein
MSCYIGLEGAENNRPPKKNIRNRNPKKFDMTTFLDALSGPTIVESSDLNWHLRPSLQIPTDLDDSKPHFGQR